MFPNKKVFFCRPVILIALPLNGLQIGDGRAFKYKSFLEELNFQLPHK